MSLGSSANMISKRMPLVHQEAIWRKHVAQVLAVELAHEANAPAFAVAAATRDGDAEDEISSIASTRYSFSNADEPRPNRTLVAHQCTPAPTQSKATEMKHKTLF